MGRRGGSARVEVEAGDAANVVAEGDDEGGGAVVACGDGATWMVGAPAPPAACPARCRSKLGVDASGRGGGEARGDPGVPRKVPPRRPLPAAAMASLSL